MAKNTTVYLIIIIISKNIHTYNLWQRLKHLVKVPTSNICAMAEIISLYMCPIYLEKEEIDEKLTILKYTEKYELL